MVVKLVSIRVERVSLRYVDFGPGFGEVGRTQEPMPSPIKKKKLSYPEESEGSRTAAETRRRANGQTGEQRREHFRQAMAMIYAGQHAAKATGAGH